MAFHSHPFHELIIVVAGSLGVEINGQTIEARPGDILWYPQGVRHREWTDPKDPGETFFVAFEHERPPAVLHQPDAQGRIQVLARWLYAEREAHASSGSLHPENAFLQALVAEFHRLTTRREHQLVTRMRTYMRQRLSKPISLDDLADFAHMSKFHFVRHYKALAGCTPMRDLRSLRIQAARDLLLTTNLPLKEISPRTGLGDEYHLSRLFRTHFNITPGAMRRTSMINPL
jgi:AraC-like DNA-binding protein